MKLFYSFLKIFIFWAGIFFLPEKCISQLTLAEWNFPNPVDDAIIDINIPANAGKTIYTTGGTAALQFGVAGVTTRAAWCTGWDNGILLKSWEVEFSTLGYNNLELSSKQQGSNTGPRDFKIQYKIGIAGIYTDLGINVSLTTGGWNGPTSFLLPLACENQASVYIRWIMTSNTSIIGGTTAGGGASRIDDINISANNSTHHYRTIASGNWNNTGIWQMSPNLVAWSAATMPPSQYSLTIAIRAAHVVTANSNVKMDEVTIQTNGTVFCASATQTINDGPGIDLQVDGTFIDGSNIATVWTGVAPRWALGAGGTYIKTGATNATNWQNNYNGGISTIPATANWIIRKTSGAINPALTSVSMFYPNLTIENVSGGNWVTGVGSTFTGALGFTTIKGTFDIGGTQGLGTVDFLSDNTNAQPTIVTGNMTLRTGSALRNYGTGFELRSNLTVDGTTSYDANDARKFVFTQGAAQSISGSSSLAAFGIYQMQVNKTANDITLNRAVKVNNNLDLISGIINSSMPTNIMWIEDNATVTNTSNASFVRGPVRKLGDEAFTFPVGKNNDYQAIGFSAGPPVGGPVTFWTENFTTGAGWTLANVTGPEGSDPNPFYIGAGEGGGIPPGGCGVANNGNNTMHVGSVFNPPGGAAYDAGGLCGILFCPQTNRRAQSPAINCTGFSTITLSFNYIEFGSGSVDNMTLWYYDGSTWIQISDPAKTPCCGGACNGFRQGQWTNYTIVLPASADNNPNVRIGYKWENNDDGVGTDPSFAVDDISLSVTGGAPESFTAEYFYSNPQVPYGNILLPNLTTISNCEYWILTRDIGTSNRFVTLYFDGNSCGFQAAPANLLVANHNSGQWYDRGNGGFTASSVITFAAQTVYGPYTLGSIVPLPVELVYFDAKYNGETVDLTWTTASEINNDFFIVERTKDGEDFSVIAKVKGAGTSTSPHYYKASDRNPLKGVSYYRLKQTDFNGENSFSRLVPVQIDIPDFGITYFYPDQSLDEIYFQLKNIPGKLKVEVIDMLGRIIISQELTSSGDKNIFKINSSILKTGIYTLRISNNSSVVNRKFSY